MKFVGKLVGLCLGITSLGMSSLFGGLAEKGNADYLFKVKDGSRMSIQDFGRMLDARNSVEDLKFNNWARIQVPEGDAERVFSILRGHDDVEVVQPNYVLGLLEDFREKDPLARQLLQRKIDEVVKEYGSMENYRAATIKDNLDIPAPPTESSVSKDDPLFSSQWGMIDIGVKKAWDKQKGDPNMVVAVLDTGTDYTHEDLLPSLWRNPGETGKDASGKDKATNGVDDDNNGFVDDQVGWDFASKDNKPFDLTTDIMSMLTGGGNPGHGTHCAGNVAAKGFNGKGIAGVAPNVKVMTLRFITEKGQGTTADAIGAIKYAVDNGAKVLSNSWGGEGVDDNSEENVALKEAVAYSEAKGRIFVVAAGNGRNGVGYNNDTDSKPVFPASYDFESIISVAAVDKDNNIGAFSNFGKRTVDLGAPGVAVFSTMVGNKYSDKVIDFFILKANWDGTSMACPHVAGAAALYWSAYPHLTAQEVKNDLLKSTVEIPALKGKVLTDGKLNVEKLFN